MNVMRQWLDTATKEQAEKMAKLAKTSLATLRQIAGGYRTAGSARTTPEAARNIELASAKVTPDHPIPRGKLCPACAKCEFYKERKTCAN